MEQGRFQIQGAGTALAIVLGTLAMIAVAVALQSLHLGPSGAFFTDSPSDGSPHTTWSTSGEGTRL